MKPEGSVQLPQRSSCDPFDKIYFIDIFLQTRSLLRGVPNGMFLRVLTNYMTCEPKALEGLQFHGISKEYNL